MKTITIRDETYSRFLAIKENDDSFSDVIDRLAGTKNRDIRDYAGRLKNSRVLDELRTGTITIRNEGRDNPIVR